MDSNDCFAPVMITTLNRYSHFKRCLESLSRCTFADKTEVFIGLDYPPNDRYVEGYLKNKDYLASVENIGFKAVHIITRDKNYGAIKNWDSLKKLLFETYDAIIATEDDNEFSPCFLDYMNYALKKYKDDEQVSSVAGFSDECCYDQGNCMTYFCYSNSAWGVGYWKSKETIMAPILNSNEYYAKKIISVSSARRFRNMFPRRFSMLVSMILNGYHWDDVKRSTYNYFENKYQIRPTISLCRNWGNDGSGIHGGTASNDYYGSNRDISGDYFFRDNGEVASPVSPACLRLYRQTNLESEKIFRRLWYSVSVEINYLSFIVKYYLGLLLL